MKKLALLLSLFVLISALCIPAFAADESEPVESTAPSVNVGDDKLGADVNASTKEPAAVYSATIEWGGMNFVYDPWTTGVEDEARWTADDNTVTVTNDGTRSINVAVKYTSVQDFADKITGSFDQEAATLAAAHLAEVAQDGSNIATFTLTLSGTLEGQYEEVQAGSVTVTLTPVA